MERVAVEAGPLRSRRELLLDSQQVVGGMPEPEDLVQECRIPPDMEIREGAYNSVDEATDEYRNRIEQTAANCNQA